MANTINCTVVSAEEKLFSGQATMVVASGMVGELGIRPGHTPLLTELKPGQIRVLQDNGTEEVIYISGGLLEVQPNQVNVLSDTALRAADLDEAAAIEAKAKAEQAMQDQQGEFEYSQAAAELAQAIAQIRAIKMLRDKKH